MNSQNATTLVCVPSVTLNSQQTTSCLKGFESTSFKSRLSQYAFSSNIWIMLQNNLREGLFIVPFSACNWNWVINISLVALQFPCFNFSLYSLMNATSCGLLSNIWAWLLRRSNPFSFLHHVTQDFQSDELRICITFKYSERVWKAMSGLVSIFYDCHKTIRNIRKGIVA